MLVKTARQVEALTHDLLDVARAEAGAVKVDLRPTDVRGVLEDVRRSMILLPEAAGLKIEVVADGDALFGRQFDALHLLQSLDARLGLRRLGGLGLEAVDELLQVGALGVLLGLGRRHQAQLLGPRLFEGVVVAGVEVQLAVRQLQDVGRLRNRLRREEIEPL